MPWFFWVVVAVVMAVVEVMSLGLITMWFVVGALAALVASLLGADLFVQCAVFLVVSIVLLVALRPAVLKYRKKGASTEPTLVGQRAVVEERIDNDRMVGRVRTSDNMTWAARSADGAPIEEGASVAIVAQESIKLVVERG